MEYETVSLFVIGTELTRGVITDRHCQFLSSEMSRLGYRIDRMVIVPDDGTIGKVLRESIDDSDVVLITGGLGPTSDDMTRQMIAEVAGVPLVKDEQAWQTLFERVGQRIYGANERQVMIPQGFEVVPNPKGTAPGFRGFIAAPDGRSVACAAMPGPPSELQEMFLVRNLPWLASLRGTGPMQRDEFSVFMIPESKLEDVFESVTVPEVSMGDRFQDFRISLYVSGGTDEQRSLVEQRLAQALGPALMVEGDHQAVDLLTQLLEEEHLTISCAESCTGGLAAKLLTDRAGSSAWFYGGAVTYANEAKHKILGVSQETLDGVGPVSGECVAQMAEGMLRLSGTDVAFSISGIAGPDGGTDAQPVGTVWFGFAQNGRPTQSVCLRMTSWGRDAVRRRAALSAMILASLFIKGRDLLDTVKQWQYI